MLNIPTSVKNLFGVSQSVVKKGFRVKFPNGEYPDITNENIIKESLKFTESICSRQNFRFGLAEASAVEFETIGIGDMRGMLIQCYLDVDVSSLPYQELVNIRNGTWDGELVEPPMVLPYFEIPLGVFVVSECPQNHEQNARRRVIAYTPSFFRQPSPVEQAKIQCAIPYPGYTYRPLVEPLVLSQLAFESDDDILAAGWTAAAASSNVFGGSCTGIKIRVTDANSHELDVYVSYIYLATPVRDPDIELYGVELDKAKVTAVQTAVDNYLATLGVQFTTAKVANTVEVPIPNVAALRDLVARQYQVYDGVEYHGSNYPAPGYWCYDAVHPFAIANRTHNSPASTSQSVEYIDMERSTKSTRFIAYCPFGVFDETETEQKTQDRAAVVFPITSLKITVDDITAGTSTESPFITFQPPYTGIYKYSPPASSPLAGRRLYIEPAGDEQEVSTFLGQLDYQQLVNDYAEIRALCSTPSRAGGMRTYHLSKTAQADYDPTLYHSCWIDEHAGQEYGIIRFGLTLDGKAVAAEFRCGNGAGIYDMSDNLILKSAGFDYADACDLLTDYFVPYINGLPLKTVEMEARGLPYVEAGDCVGVETLGGSTVAFVNTRMETTGVQALRAGMYAVGPAQEAGDNGSSGSGAGSGSGSGGGAGVTSVNGMTGAVTVKEAAAATTFSLGAGASGVTSYGTGVYDPNTSTVRLYLIARSTSNMGFSTVLATVPEAYRPSSTVTLYGAMCVNSLPFAYTGRLYTTGNIVQDLSASAREVFLCGEYVI